MSVNVCPAAGDVRFGPRNTAPASQATNYLEQLLPGVTPDKPVAMNTYAGLGAHKRVLLDAFAKAGVAQARQALYVAMAMLETTTLSADDRDATKDNDGPAANVSCWNLSIDMVKLAGYAGDPWALNSSPVEAVKALEMAFNKWGVPSTLDFVRGGRKGFADHVSYGCQEYQHTIATILHQIDLDGRLMSDDRRVEVYLVHV